MRERLGDGFYMVYFQQPGVADAELARDPRHLPQGALRRLRRRPRAALPLVPPGGGFLDVCAEPPELPVAG